MGEVAHSASLPFGRLPARGVGGLLWGTSLKDAHDRWRSKTRLAVDPGALAARLRLVPGPVQLHAGVPRRSARRAARRALRPPRALAGRDRRGGRPPPPPRPPGLRGFLSPRPGPRPPPPGRAVWARGG